jgi:phosphoacetylglucosamine mutase
MERAAFRVGLVVARRAKIVGNMGVMVTASHNHHEDNGVKIIEPDGSMLVQDWELIAEMLINSKDLETSLKTFN